MNNCITSEHDKVQQAKENLNQMFKSTIVFVDTCSCLHDRFGDFVENAKPYMIMYDTKLYIPYKCVEELIKKAQDKDNNNLAVKANNAYRLIMKLYENGLLEVRGKESDSFADSTILQNFLRYKEDNNLTLITQDYKLSVDVLALNNTGSINSRGHTITVKKINGYGYLTFFRPRYEVAPFVVSETMYNGSFEYERTPNNFSEGSTLFLIDGTPITLGTLHGQGGEGAVYDVAAGIPGANEAVVKIFNEGDEDDKKPFYSRTKVSLLLENKLNNPSVSFPIAEITNDEHKVVGYIMPKAHGVTLHRLVQGARASIEKYLPNSTKREMVQLCISIIAAVKYLHDNGIIIGDLQWDNILVESPTKITIIDTDSFQLNEYPCPVGKVAFTAPERQNQAYGTYMRGYSDDLFALATLLFIIMVPGKFPYDMRGGDDVQQNILNGNFSYPNGENSNGQAPMGNWRFCWSHLPAEVKDKMYNTFHKDGRYHDAEKRLSAAEWLRVFQEYLRRIDNGDIAAIDSMSLELIPLRTKKQRGVEYARCKDCGIEYPLTLLQRGHGYCPRCLEKGEEYECEECGTPMIYTRREQLEKMVKYPTCSTCSEKTYETRICPVDGKQFTISVGEYNYYKFKGLDLPVRCLECRKAHHNGNVANIVVDKNVPRDSSTVIRENSIPVSFEKKSTPVTPGKTTTSSKQTNSIFDFFKSLFGY